MSSADLEARTAVPAPTLAGLAEAHPRIALGLAILAATALGQLTAFATASAVWSTGAFFDTDDAMRAVQVRDLIAGQGWFDMTAHRLDPPAGVFMHWSRIVDVPLVLLIKGFELVAEPVTAERLARLAFPFLLTLALFALLVPLCERLLGPAVRLPALAAAFLSGPATGQFEPGRIDHHAPQIVLLVACVGALIHALGSGRASRAAWAGAAMALSLGISIENVPFFAPVFAWLTLLWIARGRNVAALLVWFATGLALTLPLVFGATIAPARWLLAVPDALSLAQASAAMAGAAFLAGLVAAGHRLPDDWPVRAVVAVLSATLVGALLAHAFPLLVRDPFADLDPLLRTAWLDGVDEAQPLLRKAAADPFWTIGVIAPALLGLFGAIREGARTANGPNRAAWLLLALAIVGGLAASFAMVRTLSATLTVAVPGALALALTLRDAGMRRVQTLRGPLPLLLSLLAVSPMGWAIAGERLKAGMVAPPTTPASLQPARGNLAACTRPDAFAALARLPPGLVLAEPDLGSFILAHTDHSVLAGAYHRDRHGLRLALETLMADPDGAITRMRAADVRYLVVCNTASSLTFATLSPSSLAVSLTAEPIRGLRHLAARDSEIGIYAIE